MKIAFSWHYPKSLPEVVNGKKKKKPKQNFRFALKGLGLRHRSLEVIRIWPRTERSSLSSSKNHIQVFHKPFMAFSLTSHGAEPKLLVSIVVLSGSTPLHVVPPSLRSAVGVVAVVVQEGEVAQSTIGIATTSLDQNCTKNGKNRCKCSLHSQHAWKSLQNKPPALLFPTCVLYIIHRPLFLALINSDVKT